MDLDVGFMCALAITVIVILCLRALVTSNPCFRFRHIIAFILATDLKSHSESIMKFSARKESPEFLKLLDNWLLSKSLRGVSTTPLRQNLQLRQR